MTRAEEEKRFHKERETKKRLRSPQQEARAELRDLYDYRDALHGEELNRGRSQIAQKLMGTMGGGEIQPVGMVEQGAESHSLVTKLSMPDAKETLMHRRSSY